ncbi:MAG TPA: response regulator [Planctomycetota bacterium]
MGSLKILIVDAERASLQLAEETLSKRGHEVRTATDGQTALNLVSSWPPDLILLDPAVPVMDGYQLVRLLRARPGAPLLPVLFQAPKKEVQERIAGFHLDTDDYMPKPINPQELEIRVRAAMKRRGETERRLRPASPEGDDWTVRMSGMRGSLALIGLPTVLTTLEMDRKSGVLVVAADELKAKARLEVQKGMLVRATLDGKSVPVNHDLIYALIPCVKGKFDFRPKVITAADEIRTPMSSLILEGARRADEVKRANRRPF